MLNEGADCPLGCLLFMRPTESKRIFFQQLGAAYGDLRKVYCTVGDFIGNFRNASRIPDTRLDANDR